MLILQAMLLAVTLVVGSNAHAVSLAGRPTDETVCDLSPLTNYRLTRKTFVPQGTSRVWEIYSRLALQFITSECRNGQVLILHSDLGSSVDERSFRDVTGELCSPADVTRDSAATREYPHAFQVKCKLAKIQDAKQRLAAAEGIQTVDEMIQERAPAQRSVDAGENAPKPKECSQKIGLGQVLLGLGGNCR
ncbi:hypothetical protein [Pseudoduganella sp. UC29_71]|uniref:hypothetical protein n=1 Tax=Pseudoduganella sp. UC29_71 TaxID=3350174 RepID=UPI0036712065